MFKKKYKVVLHIGTEKTGTTALQKFLSANKSLLAKSGIAPVHGKGIANCVDLAACCLEYSDKGLISEQGVRDKDEFEHYRASVTAHYQKVLGRLPRGARVVVLSSEHFHSRLKTVEDIARLRSLLEPFAERFAISCYVRPQVELVSSLYSTYLRGGGTANLKLFSRQYLQPDNHYCNYSAMLRKWAAVFDDAEIRVKEFDKKKLREGNIIVDFLDQLGVAVGKQDLGNYYENSSIDLVGQIWIREINKLFGKQEDRRLLEVRSEVANAFAGRGETLSIREQVRSQHMYEASNREVALEWADSSDLFEGWCASENLLPTEQVKAVRRLLGMLLRKPEMGEETVMTDASVDRIRNAAMSLMEGGDRDQVAMDLLLLAQELRPSGQLIKNKIEQLRRRLEA